MSLKFVIAAVAVAALAGCASAPKTTAQLESAQQAYQRAAGDAQVASSAPVQLRDAEASLRQAERLLQQGAELTQVDHQAYLSERRTATAVEVAKLAAAEAAIRNAGMERDRVLIESRTREADARGREADAASRRAAEETQRAQAARQLAEQRQKEADAARQQATEAAERAKKLEAQVAALKARPTDRGLVLTLGDVLFDVGKATLKPGAMRTIDQLATFMREQANRKVLIEGHTDSVGSDELNRRLSEDRANAVRYALLDRQIASDRVLSRGFGEMYPVANNNTAAGRQQNRRVEVVISDESGTLPNDRR